MPPKLPRLDGALDSKQRHPPGSPMTLDNNISGSRNLIQPRLRMKGMKRPDTPFPKHWFYYIAVKYTVIASAILIALDFLFQVL